MIGDVIAAAFQGIGGAIIFAGAVSVAGVGLWKMWGKPAQEFFLDLKRTINIVAVELKINGEEDLLPKDLQRQPLRALVIHHVVASADTLSEQRERNELAAATAITAAAHAASAAAATATAAAEVAARAATAANLVLEQAAQAAAHVIQQAASDAAAMRDPRGNT